MLFALVDGCKSGAIPQTRGKCQLCESEVFSKCGEVNVWHWAHFKDKSCDTWYEPETDWHRNWKLIFGKENSEIVISKDGVRHFADIKTKGDVIIELQNSPIQKPIIRRRENFYGERMLWVINGILFKKSFAIYVSSFYREDTESFETDYYNKLHGFSGSNSRSLLGYKKNEFSFSWNWPRKSWNEVQRNIFIDFGDNSLLWIIEGMGTKHGKAKRVGKEGFVKRYGGDISLLPSIIEKGGDLMY